VSVDVDLEIDTVVRRITAHGFSTTITGPRTVALETLATFWERVRSERLDGLLLEAWRDGAIELTDNQVAGFGRTHRNEMEQALRLERAALDVVGMLADLGIDSVVLKGMALANTVYADAGWRSFGDVDLLLDPEGFAAGIDALVAVGARRDLPEVRPGFDARFAKDVPVVLDAMTIDLHRTLIRGPFGERIPVPTLLAASRPAELGGRRMRVLAPADAYVFAALTAGAADVPARLITLRDLLELERAPDFDPDAVRHAAAFWRVEPALARAVRGLDEVLRPDQPLALLAWARRFAPGRIDRFYMSCYTSPARSYRSTLATVLAIPTWSDRARFTRALLVPQRSYRQARGWSLGDHVRRGFSKLGRKAATPTVRTHRRDAAAPAGQFASGHPPLSDPPPPLAAELGGDSSAGGD